MLNDPTRFVDRDVLDGEEAANYEDIKRFVEDHRATTMETLDLEVWGSCVDVDLVEQLQEDCEALGVASALQCGSAGFGGTAVRAVGCNASL